MIPVTDSLVHIVGLGVALFLAYVGLLQRNSTLNMDRKLDRIDAKIDKHEATDEVKHAEFERRISAIER